MLVEEGESEESGDALAVDGDAGAPVEALEGGGSTEVGAFDAQFDGLGVASFDLVAQAGVGPVAWTV